MSNRALVLTGGGARGAYQAGVLKYIGECIPEAHFEILVGSSSGAINIAGVASCAGRMPEAGPMVAKLWEELEMNEVFRTDIFSIAKSGVKWAYDLALGGFIGRPLAHSLVDTMPLRRLMERIYRPEVLRDAIQGGSIRGVAISATEVYSGSLVTFVQSQSAKMWERARRRSIATEIGVEHIMASSAIPLLFPSALINNRRYVDGCIRSTTPLGPAMRLGADKVLAVGVRRYYMQEMGNHFEPVLPKAEAKPSMAQLGALVLNSLFAESLDADVEHLERLNAILPEQRAGSFGMKKVESLVIRPSEDLGQLATHFVRRMPGTVRFLLRGLGSERGDSNDMLSYLLFVPEYLSSLVELGYADARAEDARLRKFLLEE